MVIYQHYPTLHIYYPIDYNYQENIAFRFLLYNYRMTIVQRYDYADLKATKTDEGFLHDTPVVGRVGIQEYLQKDGTIRREYRPAEEVFHADALASMRGKPLTIDHPKSGVVTSKDSHRVTVGTMLSEGKQDGDFLKADIVIHNPDAMGDRKQLSLGYKADMDETPGEYNGQPYDAIQRNIRVNHLSIVRVARAGNVAKLNLDSLDQTEDFSTQQEQQTMSIVKVKLDSGLEYDAAPEVSVELAKLRKDATDATAALAVIPTLTAERDVLKARVDGIPAEIEKAQAQGKQDAEAKVKLDAVATALKVDTKDKTSRQIKEAVIKAVTPKLVLDGKDDAYIDVAFDMAVEMKGDVAMAKQRQDGTTTNTDKPQLTSAERRDAMVERAKEKK
jgi:hypothetical protein